jgi:hypothetical protein
MLGKGRGFMNCFQLIFFGAADVLESWSPADILLFCVVTFATQTVALHFNERDLEIADFALLHVPGQGGNELLLNEVWDA